MDVQKIKLPTRLRLNAADSPVVMIGDDPVRVSEEDILLSVVKAAGEWSKVVIDTGGGKGPEGHVKTLNTHTVSLKGEEIKQTDFAALCASACSAHLVDLGYLLALARTESGVSWKNDGTIGADVYTDAGASGPFQFMPATWDGLVRQIGAKEGVRLADIIRPGPQARLAAFMITEAIVKHQEQFSDLPNVPELYLYHLFGWPAARTVLSGQPTDGIHIPLLLHYKDQEKVNKILTGNKSLLMDSGNPRTLAGLLREVARRFEQSYKANLPLLTNAPQWWPLNTNPSGGPAPWLAVARQEIGQTEIPGANHNPRISEYLATVGFEPSRSDETAWCAAFVCWCLINSGDPAAAAAARGLKDRSFASAWLNLPNMPAGPAIGSIGIAKSRSPDTTGHVGFVTDVKGDDVMFLAGNQSAAGGGPSDRVSEIPFKITDFTGFRWPT